MRKTVIEISLIVKLKVKVVLFVFHICLCCALLSVSYSLVVTCWERDDLYALLSVDLYCACVTFDPHQNYG